MLFQLKPGVQTRPPLAQYLHPPNSLRRDILPSSVILNWPKPTLGPRHMSGHIAHPLHSGMNGSREGKLPKEILEEAKFCSHSPVPVHFGGALMLFNADGDASTMLVY